VAEVEKAGAAMAQLSLLCRALVIAWASAVAVSAPTAVAEPLGNNGYNGAPTIVSGAPLPTMNGVPCVGSHFGTCMGFAQNQPVPRQPISIVGHAPTTGR
jgi:hypothetical protein